MATTEVAESELARLLRRADASSLKAYKDILKAAAAEAITVERTTVAQRKERLRTALESYDTDRLLELAEVMRTFVDEVTDPTHEITMAEPRQLTHSESVTLMQRWLVRRDIDEFCDVVRQMTRELVLVSVAEANAAAGADDPEHTNGRIEVPELGHAFCVEGNGQKDPELDESLLEQLMGEQAFAEVCDEEVIPEHVQRIFSPEKFIAAAQRDPKLVDTLREAIVAGGYKTGRLVVRPLSGK